MNEVTSCGGPSGLPALSSVASPARPTSCGLSSAGAGAAVGGALGAVAMVAGLAGAGAVAAAPGALETVAYHHVAPNVPTDRTTPTDTTRRVLAVQPYCDG